MNEENDSKGIRRLTMDRKGRIRKNHAGTVVRTRPATLFTVFGWISAGLAAFFNPLFAVPGIVFGVLLNRQESKGGNPIIITSIVVASINILFRLFLIAAMQNALYG